MSDYEQWVLDSLALNDATFTLEQLSAPVPTKLAEWIKGADSDGAILARPPKHENRVIEMTLRVAKQSTMDLALAKIGLILNKLQEAEQNENGLGLAWTPADATLTLTGRCLMGEIVDLPIDWEDSGWLVYTPLVRIRLTCLPFFEGTESLLGTVTSSDPLITRELTAVAGDAQAKGRLVVTDAASQSRRYLVWGLESRWYPTSSPPSLIVDSAGMVATGYAGVTATRSGAYSGGSNNVISATVQTQVQAICGLGNLSHVGQFRPQMRFYASATTVALRLTYQTLAGPFRSLAYKVPVAVGWNHVDLGLITVPQTTLGTQRWTGRIEAYSTATGGETLDVDAVWMVPAEQFGRARATSSRAAGVLVGRDGFTGITAGVALHARTAPSGGVWATSGATTDLVAADAPGAAETMTRATTADSGTGRFAILGSTTYADSEAGVRFVNALGADTLADTVRQTLILRYVDASNYLAATVTGTVVEVFFGGVGTYLTTEYVFSLDLVVAGATTTLDAVGIVPTYDGVLRATVRASGVFAADLVNSGGAAVASIAGQRTELATGGALATGKPGLRDYAATAGATSRYYDDFYVATPDPEPMVCYSGQSIEIRSDGVLREDSTGTYAGPPPEYVGSYFTIPPAGGPGRKTRIAVMAKRNDVATSTDDNIADSTTVDVYATPRYLAIPR